jgi:hypothetical protein
MASRSATVGKQKKRGHLDPDAPAEESCDGRS